MNKKISGLNIRKLILCFILVIVMVFNISVVTIVSAANKFVEYDTPWTLGEPYIQVYNRRTGKYTVGAYNRDWDNNVTTSDVYIGDVIEVDAYFQYNGGAFWRYENGTQVEYKKDNNGNYNGHYRTTFTISKSTTKVSCSCTENAIEGEQLSVTLNATTDENKPTVRVYKKDVEKDTSLSIELRDDKGVVAYIVTESPAVPNQNSSWTRVTSNTRVFVTYTPTKTIRYYVWAKDDFGNISEPDFFDCGVKPQATITSDVEVQAGQSATFSCNVVEGTAPLSYQWYYADHNTSINNGTAIDGATSSTYTIEKTTSLMDGRYYYCVVSNKIVTSGVKSKNAKLTVYKTFTLSQLSDVSLKKGETHTFSVTIIYRGNPDSYTYQWYKAGSDTDLGSKISGANSSEYTLTPREDVTEWYWCVVSNGQFSVSTNKAMVRTDINDPVIKLGTFNEDIYINSSNTLVIPIIVVDGGQGYTETSPVNNLRANEIVLKVDGETVDVTDKSLAYKNRSANNYNYDLTIPGGLTGNGKLSLEFPAGIIKDDFNNTNARTLKVTNVTVDNTSPNVIVNEITSGVNNKYANKTKTIEISLLLTEEVGLDTSLFETRDINVVVGGASSSSNLRKKLDFIERKNGSDYYYKLTLSNVEGNGNLVLNIPSGSFNDYAFNNNANLNVNTEIIIDNNAPQITDFHAVHGNSNTSSASYPGSLEPWHQGWTNDNIYISIIAIDSGGAIDYYAKAYDKNGDFKKLESNSDLYDRDTKEKAYYRVYDYAGNYAEYIIDIKRDSTKPKASEVKMFEGAVNGPMYSYGSGVPTARNLAVKPDLGEDVGDITSGIYALQTTFDYNKYDSASSMNIDSAGSFKDLLMTESVTFTEDGYYEIFTKVTDLAGNVTTSGPYKASLRKLVDNVIRITNIDDLGSGVGKCTIEAFRVSDGSEAMDKIVIENPYKEISRTLRLGNGKFRIVVTLEDNTKNANGSPSPNRTVYETTIENKF